MDEQIEAALMEAGHRIERLQARVAELEEALRPFAAAYHDEWDDEEEDVEVYMSVDDLGEILTVGNFRKAQYVLEGKG